jgi:hypothetical protein
MTRRNAALDVVHVRDVGLAAAPDPQVLEWAAAHGRVLLTHDRRTVPGHAYARTAAGLPMPGVFLVSSDMLFAQAIQELLIAVECLSPQECEAIVNTFRCERRGICAIAAARSGGATRSVGTRVPLQGGVPGLVKSTAQTAKRSRVKVPEGTKSAPRRMRPRSDAERTSSKSGIVSFCFNPRPRAGANVGRTSRGSFCGPFVTTVLNAFRHPRKSHSFVCAGTKCRRAEVGVAPALFGKGKSVDHLGGPR